MKSLKSSLNALCVCCLLLAAAPLRAQQGWDPYPDSLDVGKNHLDYVSYPFRGGQFLRFFQFNLGAQQRRFDTADIFEKVHKDQLMNLQNLINDPKDKKSYAALTVIYGLKTDMVTGKAKMVFIYLPVLVRLNDMTPGGIDTFTVIPGGYAAPPGKENHYYVLNGAGDIVPVDQQLLPQVNSWIDAYKTYIRIDPKGTGVFRSYMPSDVTSETFSYKSLEYYFRSCPDLYITCGAKQAEELGVDTFKHYVAFANLPFNVPLDPATVQAADLGTLCPPNCLITRIVNGRPLQQSFLGWLVATAIAAVFAVTYFFGRGKKGKKANQT